MDWDDAFTQFKKSRLLGAYPPSKAYQILSTYKLKQDLLGILSIYFLFLLLF